MSYLGNTPSETFHQATSQVFNGDGSTTAFTLEKRVNRAEEIEVFVNNIQQQPTVAYSANNNTLTFTEAPDSATGNIYVVYRMFAQQNTFNALHDFTDAVTMASTLAVTGETTLSTHLNLGDNDKIKLGASGDLEVYHDGSNSFIDDGGTGNLFLRGESQVIIGNMTGEQSAVFNDDGAVQLNHDNSLKLATSSTGITVTGNIANASGDFTLDVAGDISIDAGGGDTRFKHNGTEFLAVQSDNSLCIFKAVVQDKDIQFRGNDGGSTITALTLDMSEGGDATFNGKVIADTFTKSDDTNTQINFLGSDVTQFKNGNSESARFIQTTFFKQTNANGTYRDSTGQFNEFNTDRSGDSVLTCQMSHASYSGGGFQSIATRSATGDTYRLIECYSGNAADREFRVDSDGTVHADGSYTGTGADYAEMFEWKDGNTSNEDRVGKTVVLDGDKIRLSTSDDKEETIIGVVSATPVVLGDAQSEKWKEKYATDDYGRYIFEEYTQTEWIEEVGNEAKNFRSYNTDKIPSDVTVPKDAKVTSKDENGDNLKRRKLNSAFDASKTYIPREKRKEFSAIGLVGKLRVNVGQTVGDRWIKMREISDTVHEYLVR